MPRSDIHNPQEPNTQPSIQQPRNTKPNSNPRSSKLGTLTTSALNNYNKPCDSPLTDRHRILRVIQARKAHCRRLYSVVFSGADEVIVTYQDSGCIKAFSVTTGALLRDIASVAGAKGITIDREGFIIVSSMDEKGDWTLKTPLPPLTLKQ